MINEVVKADGQSSLVNTVASGEVLWLWLSKRDRAAGEGESCTLSCRFEHDKCMLEGPRHLTFHVITAIRKPWKLHLEMS